MSDTNEQDRNPRIALTRSPSRLESKRTVESGMVRQSFSHGRSKSVAVEVKRRRGPAKPALGAPRPGEAAAKPTLPGPGARARADAPPITAREAPAAETGRASGRRPVVLKPLTEDEKSARAKALAEARRDEAEARKRAEEDARRRAEDEARRKAEEAAAARRKTEEETRKRTEEEARKRAEEQAARLLAEGTERQRRDEVERAPQERAGTAERGREQPAAARAATPATAEEQPRTAAKPAKPARVEEARPPAKGKARPARPAGRRDEAPRGSRLVLDSTGEVVERQGPSLAALRRRRERERPHVRAAEQGPIVREVVLPETITVLELSNRMAVRGSEVVKQLMRMGVMATLNQAIDADTAELVVAEFGHRSKRVSEADVEEGLEGAADAPEALRPRAPVVTVMGHVDHGKTSLLDALRQSDVAAHEAGGITQHIGAYQVDIGTGYPVTFIDTPGHEAFTAMRARGAQVTDIVVLVVAADDGVMPQTVEAIRHAQAAGVPIVVAINKIDRPEANPDRVKQELLNHGVVLEAFGGEVLGVEVSAIKRQNLDKLVEAIQLQAEILEVRANPEREAQGAVIEAKLERGRGVTATVLVQRGTLRVGDVVVCGAQWGRVRALVNDRGQQVAEAGPSVPVEVLGLDGVPEAGDILVALDNEKRARDIAEYRQRKRREQQAATGARGTLQEMFSQLAAGEVKELPVVVKTDVHGSLEAITAGLERFGTDEVKVRVLHGGVGAITESDISLALASKALVIGFNVRANAQAREMAKRDGVEIRYYSIIYELLDDAKAMLSGMLAPGAREQILGHAEIREVFSIPRAGKIAGCRVVDGVIRRGAKVRLLRDDVVIHEGTLGSLRRFKEDAREVREGFECGIGLEGYNDFRQNDVIEAYEVQEVARTL